MYEYFLLNASKHALYLVLIVSAPPLLAGMIAGVAVSVLQTVTSVQEQTLSIVVKLITVFAVLVIAGPLLGTSILRFASEMFASIAAPIP